MICQLMVKCGSEGRTIRKISISVAQEDDTDYIEPRDQSGSGEMGS